MKRIFAGSLLCAALAVVGCGGESEQEPSPGEQATTQTVFVTKIRVSEDGSTEATVKEISVAEQRAMISERARRVSESKDGSLASTSQNLVAVDPYCSVTSMWLFDGPHQTGNMLCLYVNDGYPSSDYANLKTIVRTQYYPCPMCTLATLYWAGAIRSYYTPVRGRLPGGGCFERNAATNCWSYWSTDDRPYEADSCTQSADKFWTW